MKSIRRQQGWSVTIALIGFLIAPALNGTATAQDGTLDPTFGNGGVVIRDFAIADDLLFDMAVAGDGRVVGVGLATRRNALVRFQADGTLDTTFGIGGIVSDDARSFEKVTVQLDNKILVFGRQNNLTFVARYNVDGTLDSTFATNGVATIDHGEMSHNHAVRVAVRDDGTIVAFGAVFDSAASGTHFMTLRLTTTGALDTSFNGTGVVIQRFDGFTFASAMALAPGGKVVVAGSETNGHVVVRYNDDGSLDRTFRGTGIVRGSTNGFIQSPTGLAVQPDGAVVATINATGTATPSQVIRYRVNGVLDPLFGNLGVKDSFNGAALAVVLQTDGRIVTAGVGFGSSGPQVTVARFLRNGSQDLTFGAQGGLATVAFPPDRPSFLRMALQLQQDGRLVVGSTLERRFIGQPPFSDWLLLRFNNSF
jgi:uncharacterized delta-60 repeat protein